MAKTGRKKKGVPSAEVKEQIREKFMNNASLRTKAGIAQVAEEFGVAVKFVGPICGGATRTLQARGENPTPVTGYSVSDGKKVPAGQHKRRGRKPKNKKGAASTSLAIADTAKSNGTPPAEMTPEEIEKLLGISMGGPDIEASSMQSFDLTELQDMTREELQTFALRSFSEAARLYDLTQNLQAQLSTMSVLRSVDEDQIRRSSNALRALIPG